jgi:excisionase family DNA binding protein
VPPSSKPLEFQATTEALPIHSVPVNPSVIDRFGTYLVPSLPTGRLFTIKDLAERWAVCTATIYSLAKNGRLPSLRIGNSIRFSAAAVADYERGRAGAGAERHPGRNRDYPDCRSG